MATRQREGDDLDLVAPLLPRGDEDHDTAAAAAIHAHNNLPMANENPEVLDLGVEPISKSEQQEDDAIGLTRFASWCMPSRNAWRKTLIFFLTFVSASLLLLLSEINNYNINVSFVSSYAYGIFQRCHITFNLIRMAKANMKKEDSLEAST